MGTDFMEINDDDREIARLVQIELDAISLDDDPLEVDDNDEELISSETKRDLECEMQERLAAFEHEIETNFKRYQIDYAEIDDLLQKQSGNSENEIQNHVAHQCGIDRDELDRILKSINIEEAVSPAADTESNEHEDQTIVLPNKKLFTIENDQSIEETRPPEDERQQQEEEEDPQQKWHDGRIAESRRRMLDELALLEQRRNEEEERYAVVLQEQQVRLAEEYRRIQTTLDESTRQARDEKFQFEILCREQERVINERQNKMATIIQAWYRGRCIYRQYHPEISKRTALVIRTIVKKRKKKEAEDLAAARRLAKIQETSIPNESILFAENNHQVATPAVPLPPSNRLSSPLPIANDRTKKSTTIIDDKKAETIPLRDDQSKKKKVKQASSSLSTTTQIVQLEQPTDFIPTVIFETSSSVPKFPVENILRVLSPPMQTKESRPKSSSKRPRSAKAEQKEIIITESQTMPIASMPPVETISLVPIKVDSPRPPAEIISIAKPVDTLEILSTSRFTSPLPSAESIPIVHQFNEKPNSPLSRIEPLDVSPIKLEKSTSFIETTPRITSATPRQVPVQHKQSAVKSTFQNEARRWAESTRQLTYSSLLIAAQEAAQQQPTRKPGGGATRKLPDIESHLLTKATKHQSSDSVRYLLLEHIVIPCTLAPIALTYHHLTHLTLRQCKLVHLVGLDACLSLAVLDIQNNWLEQVHLQLSHLKYLNLARNRLTSLLSIHTPALRYLDISKNRLTRLNGIETWTQLNVLLVNSNQLLTTLGLQGCTHLLHLDVSDNHLVEMEQFEQCPLLVTVKAASNALIQMPTLFNAILLHELDLSSNSLASLDELSCGVWLPLLMDLRLSNNNLQDLFAIHMPLLSRLELAYNQLYDVSMLKQFVASSPQLAYINMENNPLVCDGMTLDFSLSSKASFAITLLPRSSFADQSPESIQLYLNFLADITTMFISLRQSIEQHRDEFSYSIQSIRDRCQQYQHEQIPEPMRIPSPVPEVEDRNLVRLQAHWRRCLIENDLVRKHRAARCIQARWRGYSLRRRMFTARHLFSQQQQTFAEVDLTQFDFDEAAFDARLQRPRTPVTRIRQAWQLPPPPVTPLLPPSRPSSIELARPHSSRSSSLASSRAKPTVPNLMMTPRNTLMADEWGLSTSSSTAALMLKRAEKMKWNAERKQKRSSLDAYQRLQLARKNEQPPGSLRLARRPPTLTTTVPIARAKIVSPPSTSESRSNRVFEWVHTQVARLDDIAVGNNNSPKNERKLLPSLDGSNDPQSANGMRVRPNEILPQYQQQQRWPSSNPSVPVRHPPPLLPPIAGQIPPQF